MQAKTKCAWCKKTIIVPTWRSATDSWYCDQECHERERLYRVCEDIEAGDTYIYFQQSWR